MTPCDLTIIVPTYREAANLPVLVPRITAAVHHVGLDAEILIVDDNSPDDTPDLCRRLAAEFPVRLEVRQSERGLSSAVIHGMRQARGAVLLVMDADLSHPPEKIAEPVASLNDPAIDFVIGSRYVPGAATDESWGLFRKLNSRVATWLARPLTRVADPMAGFFALRKTTFASAAPLDPIGYKIGLELIVKGRCRQVREIPIRFADRLHGTSKLTLREQVNYVRHLKRLYEFQFGGWFHLLLFLAVGLAGMGVDLASYAVLLAWLPLAAARGAAIWTAMTFNFWLNRRFTFSAARREPALRQYAAFCLSCLCGAGVNWGLSVGLCRLNSAFDGHRLAAAMLGAVGGAGFNFLLSRSFVFRARTRVGAAAQPQCGVSSPASAELATLPASLGQEPANQVSEAPVRESEPVVS